MTKRKPYIVRVQEFGRGPTTIHRFANLYDAQQFIADRWEGPDYIDGPPAFHTDYCTYRCSGFELADLGKRRWVSDVYLPDGKGYGWFEWVWQPT
jgi:hypothetical protein